MLQLDCSYMTRQENEIRQFVSKSTRDCMMKRRLIGRS